MAGSDIPKLGRDLTLEVSILRYEVVESSAGDATGLAAGIEALKARVSLSKSGQHVEYLLQVRMNNSSPWTLRRRFQQISLMHESLKRRVPCLPELPAKSVVRQFSPEYLESRKNALAGYLNVLSQRRDVLNTIEAQDFFGMSERDPNLRMRSSHDVFHAAEVQECNFGIHDFVYDAARGLLLLGASDCNWVSRIDTKITNIKLPWEPSAPDLPTSQMTLWKESVPGTFQLQFSCRFAPSISSVALTAEEEGLCLCGLSDGSIGFQKLSAPLGVSRGTTLPLIKHTAGVSALAVDEQDHWLFTASKDNSIKVYDLTKQFMLCETSASTPARAMYLDQAQHRLFTGLQSGIIMVWDTSTLPLKPLCSIPDVAQSLTRIHAVEYDSSSSTLFSASKDALRIWSVKSATVSSWGRSIGCIPVINECTAVVWAASSRELICGFATGSCVAFVLDGVAGATYAWQAHEDEVSHMQWEDAKRRLFTSSKDKKLRVWHFPAPFRDFNPIASAIISSAPQLTAPRNAGSYVENRPSTTRQVASGYHAEGAERLAPPVQGSKGPGPADDSDDDLTGWDR